MDKKESTLVGYVRDQIDAQQNDIMLFYSNLKLTLPSYIKTLTLKELRDAGAIIDSNISLPREVELKFRARADVSTKRGAVADKLKRVQDQHCGRIISVFKDLKQNIPKELRLKKLGELDDTEWKYLGVEQIPNHKEELATRHGRER